jgi:uncharacterized protein involved in copper resistance
MIYQYFLLPWKITVDPIASNRKDSGKAPAFGTHGWFGPSYQGVAAMVASPEGCGRPRLRYVTL